MKMENMKIELEPGDLAEVSFIDKITVTRIIFLIEKLPFHGWMGFVLKSPYKVEEKTNIKFEHPRYSFKKIANR